MLYTYLFLFSILLVVLTGADHGIMVSQTLWVRGSETLINNTKTSYGPLTYTGHALKYKIKTKLLFQNTVTEFCQLNIEKFSPDI